MKRKHAKSPCCGEPVYRHGKRRRICSICGKSWSIRKKKRGAKGKRVDQSLAKRYLDRHLSSLRLYAEGRSLARETVRRKFRLSLNTLIRRSSWEPIPPEGRLIAIADAFMGRIGGTEYTTYLILIKPVGSERAIICPPFFATGHEGDDWSAAFAALPVKVRNRIAALVCDGHNALRGVAKRNGWLLQRCQFHLKLLIGNYVSRSAQSRTKAMGFLVHSSINRLLSCRDPRVFWRNFAHLANVADFLRSADARYFIGVFLKHVHEYRTYLYHPELGLPATSNSAESLVRMARDVLHRTRGLRTPGSFFLWIEAMMMHFGTIACRGKIPQY